MRPTIAPGAAAALTAQIPSRLVKKLDADPTLAERWTWTQSGAAWTIKTDKDEVVKLATTNDIVAAAGDVTCTCLLQPKCLHVAAVIALLAPADAPAAEAPVTAAPVAAEPIDHDAVPAALAALRVCGDVLATGAEASGAFVQAELLRTIHGCRSAGLHRLAAAQTRVLRSIRELRADVPEFSLAALAADLRDALAIAHQLAHATPTPALVGRARRDYEPVGNLRLRGLFTEAIVARSGYAGAVTYLADESGAIYSRADVASGDVGRAAAAYDAPAGIGDAVLPHRELCRSGLFVGDATASADGRLGAGQKVRAVRATEPSHWDHASLAPRWKRALADQLAAVAQHDALPDELRPAGWDLVFVEGALVASAGGAGRAIILAIGDVGLELVTSHEHHALSARDNFGVLAKSTGVRVRAIGRVRLGAPRKLDVLALGPATGETRLVLPEAWHGRANIHYDQLSLPAAAAAGAAMVALASPPPDLLEPLRRRLERVVQGGVGTLPVQAFAELEYDAARLADRALRGGAEALRDLAAVAHGAERTPAGTRRAIDRSTFAAAWLRASLYDDAARRRLAVASW